MKKVIMAIFGAAFLGGCTMKEFSSTPFYRGSEVKFTGAVEDRVNLWPLAYWREPVGSIAWPLVSCGDDHLAFRPVYSQYKQRGSGVYDEYNLFWPMGQFDTKDDDYRLFPFFWGRDCGDDPYFCLFPAVWWVNEFNGVLPFFWNDKAFCVFPLFWASLEGKSRFNTLFPLYYYNHDQYSSKFWAFCGLAGYNRENRRFQDHRLLPFYLWNRGNFFSLPYSRFEHDGKTKTRVMLGLAGWDSDIGGECSESWALPLYYQNSKKDVFVTPLGGRDGDANWIVPLYARSASGFHTIPFSYWDDEAKGTRGLLSVPLLSGASWSASSRDYTWLALAGLVGGTSKFDGSRRSQWAAPLFYRSEKAFLSIPFGYENLGTRTNTYFAAGLAGIHSGTKEGGWLFPLYSKKKDSDFDEKLAIMDVATLPEDIKTWTVVATNKVWNDTERRYEEKVGPKKMATSLYASDKRTHLLVSDNDRSISGNFTDSKENAYLVSQCHKLGNVFAFRYEDERKVKFDLSTREKIGDTEKGWAALLGILYNHEHRADKMKGESYARHRVLWELWDWERENGDVSLDVFPGFTYDSKKDGYSKTSFLWRFFRYENDPKCGTKVDVLFIPVWR